MLVNICRIDDHHNTRNHFVFPDENRYFHACVQGYRDQLFFKSFEANPAGMRANEENPSTMRPISATCLLIVSVKDINKSCSL